MKVEYDIEESVNRMDDLQNQLRKIREEIRTAWSGPMTQITTSTMVSLQEKEEKCRREIFKEMELHIKKEYPTPQCATYVQNKLQMNS